VEFHAAGVRATAIDVIWEAEEYEAESGQEHDNDHDRCDDDQRQGIRMVAL
jgi:hypothetical protein